MKILYAAYLVITATIGLAAVFGLIDYRHAAWAVGSYISLCVDQITNL